MLPTESAVKRGLALSLRSTPSHYPHLLIVSCLPESLQTWSGTRASCKQLCPSCNRPSCSCERRRGLCKTSCRQATLRAILSLTSALAHALWRVATLAVTVQRENDRLVEENVAAIDRMDEGGRAAAAAAAASSASRMKPRSPGGYDGSASMMQGCVGEFMPLQTLPPRIHQRQCCARVVDKSASYTRACVFRPTPAPAPHTGTSVSVATSAGHQRRSCVYAVTRTSARLLT
jgi:hypothetical protein